MILCAARADRAGHVDGQALAGVLVDDRKITDSGRVLIDDKNSQGRLATTVNRSGDDKP